MAQSRDTQNPQNPRHSIESTTSASSTFRTFTIRKSPSDSELADYRSPAPRWRRSIGTIVGRVKTLLVDAFEATYNGTGNRALPSAKSRAGANGQPGVTAIEGANKLTTLSAIISTLLGTSSKFRRYYDPSKHHVTETTVDDNKYYNSGEFWLFTVIPLRIAKDLAKLGTEFVPNLVTGILRMFRATALSLARFCKNYSKYDLQDSNWYSPLKLLSNLGYGLALLLTGAFSLAYASTWVVTKVLQSITSPFAAMKQSFNYFNELSETQIEVPVKFERGQNSAEWTAVLKYEYSPPARFALKLLGGLIAAGRGLLAVGAYASLAVFCAPALLSLIGASGSVGSSIVAGLSTAAQWVASLPVISTVGSYFAAGLATVGSYLGLSISGAAATTAAFVIAATPALAALKVSLRWASPKRDYEAPKPLTTDTKLGGDTHQEVQKILQKKNIYTAQSGAASDNVQRLNRLEQQTAAKLEESKSFQTTTDLELNPGLHLDAVVVPDPESPTSHTSDDNENGSHHNASTNPPPLAGVNKKPGLFASPTALLPKPEEPTPTSTTGVTKYMHQ